nr:hypothetical protein [Candidatus Enterousia merdequi]
VVKSVSTSASKDTNTNSANTNDARISLGKYLKSTNVVRQNAEQAAYEDAHMTANDMLILRDKVETAQNDLDGMKQDMQGHIENQDVHVTTGDKENWNAKQDALEAGEGVVIEKNEEGFNVISSVMKIPVGSETAPRTAPIWIE